VFVVVRPIFFLASVAFLVTVGCGGSKKGKAFEDSTTAVGVGGQAVKVEVPWDTAGRDDVDAPVLKIAVINNGAEGVAVPYFYGYPIYAEADTSRAVLKLRHDSWGSIQAEQFEDQAGVIHYNETFTELGCTIEGIKESEGNYLPLSLICQLPPPKSLGGAKRPALGELKAGAKAAEILQDPSIRAAFFGGWHLTTNDFDTGNGMGYFNTPHGLLAFGFTGGRLDRVAYYFSPTEKRWRDAALWIAK